jgi:hypothetical protein
MADPVNTRQLEGLHEDNTGTQWLQRMASGGLRRSAGEDAAAAYALAARVQALEDAIQETYTMEQLFFALPKWWWFWVPLLYGFGFLWAMQKEHFEDRLSSWMISLMLFGVLAGLVLFIKFYREQTALRAKRLRRPVLHAERTQAMIDLMGARDRCVAAARGDQSKMPNATN